MRFRDVLTLLFRDIIQQTQTKLRKTRLPDGYVVEFAVLKKQKAVVTFLSFENNKKEAYALLRVSSLDLFAQNPGGCDFFFNPTFEMIAGPLYTPQTNPDHPEWGHFIVEGIKRKFYVDTDSDSIEFSFDDPIVELVDSIITHTKSIIREFQPAEHTYWERLVDVNGYSPETISEEACGELFARCSELDELGENE